MQTRSVDSAAARGRVVPRLRRTPATFLRVRGSIWFRGRGQDLRIIRSRGELHNLRADPCRGCILSGVVENSTIREQTHAKAAFQLVKEESRTEVEPASRGVRLDVLMDGFLFRSRTTGRSFGPLQR